MRYTKLSGNADREIGRHLDIICGEINREIGDVVSIVLMGGFAKGEGSVKLVNKRAMPLNDYDFYIITERKIGEKTLNLLEERCNRKIGKEGVPPDRFEIFYNFDRNFFVELHNMTVGGLNRALPLIRYLDLRNYGKTLCGRNVLDEIPDFKISDIPLSEHVRLIFNRMTNLIEFFNPEYMEKLPRVERLETLTYYTARAVLTAGTMLLFLSGKPDMRCEGSLRTLKRSFRRDFPELSKKMPCFLRDLELSTKWKLRPYSIEIPDIIELWFNARDYLGHLAALCFEKMLNERIEDWEDLSRKMVNDLPGVYYTPYIRHILKTKAGINSDAVSNRLSFMKRCLNLSFFLRIMRQRSRVYFRTIFSRAPPDLQIFSAAPLILFSIKRSGEIDAGMLRKAHRILNSVYPLEDAGTKDNKDYWMRLSRDYSNVKALFFFQKIV